MSRGVENDLQVCGPMLCYVSYYMA